MEKLVTVITVVFNAKGLLEPTIQSVLACKTELVEYVVIDGGSNDGSRELIQLYTPHIDHFITEPDNGIYDAMNKGWEKATGRYLVYINAGDRLQKLPIGELSSATADLLAFPVQIEGSRVLYPQVTAQTRLHNTIHHQGSFYKRVPKQTFDVQWRVFADYDLLLRMLKKRSSLLCLHEPIVATHIPDGVSNDRKASKEFFRVVYHHFGRAGQILAFAAAKLRGIHSRLRR